MMKNVNSFKQKSNSVIDKIDFEKLIIDYKIENANTFVSYLKEIFRDLSDRNGEKSQGVSNITFSKYYELPGIISQRLFAVFDIDRNGYLDLVEFIEGMLWLFCENYERLLNLIFNFYDFDKDGVISKEDVKAVLSYIPLNTKISDLKSKICKETFNDRVESQDEIQTIVETVFKDEEIIDIKQFSDSIENVNSDSFLFLLIFLFENRPFTKNTLDNYQLAKKLEGKVSKSPVIQSSGSKLIASPNLNSKFSPSLTILKKSPLTPSRFDRNEIIDKLNNTTQQNSMDVLFKYVHRKITDETPYIEIDSKEENVEYDDDDVHNIPVQRKNRHDFKKKMVKQSNNSNNNNLNNNTESTDIPMSAVKYKSDNRLIKTTSKELEDLINQMYMNDDEEDFNDEIIYEGFLYKITNKKKLKRLWFKLFNKDLYFYKSSNDNSHEGMHNLSGVFINEEKKILYDTLNLYCFSILCQQKTRLYYVDNEEDYKNWVKAIKKATGYKNLQDIYDIKEIIGKGKFGLIRLGVNKQTLKLVAVKILDKTKMNEHELELVKTEIEILKICQHPNIIRLYDIFENINYIYIIMEYCSGKDLFSYSEKRKFKFNEVQAAQIIHKVCIAIYYLHSYGIAHRDLKPENILMTNDQDNSDLKLLDFSLSKIIGPNEYCSEPYGTLSYAAPEIVLEKPYNKQVDLWSIGVIAYLLLSGSLPFDSEKNESEIAKKTISNSPNFPSRTWKKISPEGKDFVESIIYLKLGLLQKDPTSRMTITQALEHKWFEKSNASHMPEIRKSKDHHGSIFKKYTTTDEENNK